MAAIQSRNRSESDRRQSGSIGASPLTDGFAQFRLMQSPGNASQQEYSSGGRISRYDNYVQQQQGRSTTSSTAFERARSTEAAYGAIPAIPSINSIAMPNSESVGVVGAGGASHSSVQPTVLTASGETVQYYAVQDRPSNANAQQQLAYAANETSANTKVRVPCQQQFRGRNERRTGSQSRQQQPIAALNVNELPVAEANQPFSLSLQSVDTQQCTDQFYRPPSKRQHGISETTALSIYEEEHCNTKKQQEASENFGPQLAPYIPQEELFQLSDSLPMDLNLHNLFPDVDFSDFYGGSGGSAQKDVASKQVPPPTIYQQSGKLSQRDSEECAQYYDELARQSNLQPQFV
jgi:hypothetical protein